MLEEVKSMTQVKKESYREVDTSIGTYECLARIIELQGYQVDPEGATIRGCRYAKRCLQMKGKWCDMNLMTNELEFFLVRKEHMTVYESKWQLYQKATVAQDKQETAQAAVTPVKAPASGSSPPTGPKPRKKAQIDDQEQTDPVSSGQEVHAVRNGRAKAGASGNQKGRRPTLR